MLMRMRGFTMVELMVTVALGALLMSLAAPSFRTWIRNAQVRSVSESLQSGVRLAQAEAVRRYQQVVFFRTNQANCPLATTASATGTFWAIRTVPNAGGPAAQTVHCGSLVEAGSGVEVLGPTAICFSANGRLMANAAPGVGAPTCAIDGTASAYDVSGGTSEGSRPMRVRISLGGSVRMCDKSKTFAADTPEGCPP
ncbi:pilus assembly FimT family protein [Roseateles cavernae]|uniref:pilus assembly FimT family protein n=1 Tax=Roseateles cavernae TaxID=3153578 RepID=UPI0032E4C2B2